MEAFRQVLHEDLKHPIYLTTEEVGGAWCDLFPALSSSLPAPFPIFGRDEESVVTWGYPILLSDGVLKLRRNLDGLVKAEMAYRTQPQTGNGDDKQRMMAQRERYHRSISATLENVFMNDYHRGLVDLFLLFHSGEVCRALSKVPKSSPVFSGGHQRPEVEDYRQSIAAIIADLLRRAALTAADRLRKLAEVQVTPTVTPLLGIICQDQLLLVESRPPSRLS